MDSTRTPVDAGVIDTELIGYVGADSTTGTHAHSCGDEEVDPVLLTVEADVHPTDAQVLSDAKKRYQLEVMRRILDIGVDIHSNDDITLRIPSSRGVRTESFGY